MKNPKPGKYPLEHLPNTSGQALRGLSDDDLLKYIAGWKLGTENHLAGMRELAWRERLPTERRSQRAFWISCAALAMSLTAFVVNALKP